MHDTPLHASHGHGRVMSPAERLPGGHLPVCSLLTLALTLALALHPQEELTPAFHGPSVTNCSPSLEAAYAALTSSE